MKRDLRNHRIAIALVLILACVSAFILATTSPGQAAGCKSQQITMSGHLEYRDDEDGQVRRADFYERVWSYGCGTRDQGTDLVVWVGNCNKHVGRLRLNPSPIWGRDVGPVMVPCGARKVWPLYGVTYAAGEGDRCGHTDAAHVRAAMADPRARTNTRCQG